MSERIISMGRAMDGVSFNLILRLDMEEMTRLLNAEQISAVMQGITKVLNVGKTKKEQPSTESDSASERLVS